MYVITVDFTLHTQHIDAFMGLMLKNARVSRETERGCSRFEVCRDPARPECVFLYEVYKDRAAFEAHLAAAHFKAFDAATKEMIATKAVRALELMNN